MNPSRFRSRAPRRIPVAGFSSPIPFRPLSRSELLDIDDRFDEQGGSIWRDLAEQLAVLRLSTGCDDIAEHCTLEQVGSLMDAWERVQAEHMPDVDKLDAEVMLQLLEGEGVLLLDATAAAHSESPADFYGDPVGSLSDGQLAYYLTLKAAHQRWSEGDKKRCINKRLLEKRAGRSASTSRRGGA